MATYGKQMTVCYIAWDSSLGAPKTGDVANHTLRWIKDGTSSVPTNSASEVDATNAPGIYKITLTATETQTPFGVLSGKSSTSNVVIAPISVSFENIPDAAPGATGGLPTLDVDGNISASLPNGEITSATFDSTALLEIRNTFLILNDSLTSPTVTSTTVSLNGTNAANDDAYNGMVLLHFNASDELIQTRTVTDYDHGTLTLTVDKPWSVNPVDTDRLMIFRISEGIPRINPLKGVAINNFTFTMYDSTNHLPASGLSVTAERSIDGGAYAACSNSVSEISSGAYKTNLSGADVNGDVIKLKFTAPGADQQDITIVTQE